MTTPTRPSGTLGYNLVLYKRALHPELFTLRQRKSGRVNGYDYESWLLDAGHLIRFEHNGFCLCELVTEREDNLPTDGAVTTFACMGERDFEQKFTESKITYTTSAQTENLSESLYNATYKEMVDFAEEIGALRHEWIDGNHRCMSIIELQAYPKELHVQGYHLLAHTGSVLRTQTMITHE